MMEYEEIIDALFKRGVTSPYEVVPVRGDLTQVERAIANYDMQKRKKPDATPGLLVWLIRNPPAAKPIDEYKMERFKETIRRRCLALEGNVRWAIEETYGAKALDLGTDIAAVIDEVMWPGWEETPTHPDWAGPRSFVNDLERQQAVRFWRAIERRNREVRDQARMGEGDGSTGLSREGADEGDERHGEDQ